MTANDQIEQAIEAIGSEHEDDWKIDPLAHAMQLQSSAPELCSLLQRTEVARTATEYLDKNREAVNSQARYKNTVERANMAVLATGCIAALLMILGTIINADQDFSWLFAILGIIGIASGALAAMWLSRTRDGEMLRRWTQSRARAEAMRLDYFSVVIEGAADVEENPTRLELLKLEYFRRFLLDSQLAYFRIRSDQHQKSADRCLGRTTGWTCVATVLTGAAGLLAVKYPALAALAGGGIAATAAASMFSNREILSQDQANAQRYINTREKLVDISKQLTSTREMIVSGQFLALQAIYDSTRDVLMAEHSQWLEGTKHSNAALERLEGQLDKLRSGSAQT